jgi:hypothetical protein
MLLLGKQVAIFMLRSTSCIIPDRCYKSTERDLEQNVVASIKLGYEE